MSRDVRITVRGRLTEEIGSRFGGMRLEPLAGATALVGEVIDSAQLYGLIDGLRDLGLDLVGVEEVGPGGRG
jgi:hypothetical protein